MGQRVFEGCEEHPNIPTDFGYDRMVANAIWAGYDKGYRDGEDNELEIKKGVEDGYDTMIFRCFLQTVKLAL